MDAYRILLIDDQRDARQVFGDSLRTLGHHIEVVEAPSGEEALLMLTLQHFDLLITDIRLPGISGLELKKFAQLRNPNLKMILVTGLTDHRTRQEVAEAGAEAYFFKPVPISDFLEAVENSLGLSGVPVPVEVEAPAGPPETLSDRLARLRRDSGAHSALLLDERGRVTAQAGELPGVKDPEALLAAVMGMLSAGLRLSNALGSDLPEDACFFQGADARLYLAHVGAEMALLLVTEPDEPADQAAGILMEMPAAVSDLTAILAGMGVTASLREAAEHEPQAFSSTGTEEPEVDREEVAQALEEIFGKVDTGQLQLKDVDRFWESVVEENESGSVINADALSYDQARKLGLAPEDSD